MSRFDLPLLLLAALTLASAARAQDSLGTTATLPPLSFLGIPAGARLDAVARRVDSLGGARLRCDRSRRDRAVQECRGVLTDPVAGVAVEVWLSAIDSSAGVLTLSSTLSGVDFDRWRQGLVDRFGKVDARVQGTQWMLQWVRRGRMLRLTWRVEGASKVASVSLVDGRVLDRWGAARARRPAPPGPSTPPPAPTPTPTPTPTATTGER